MTWRRDLEFWYLLTLTLENIGIGLKSSKHIRTYSLSPEIRRSYKKSVCFLNLFCRQQVDLVCAYCLQLEKPGGGRSFFGGNTEEARQEKLDKVDANIEEVTEKYHFVRTKRKWELAVTKTSRYLLWNTIQVQLTPGAGEGGTEGGYLPQLTISVYAALKGIVLIWSGKGICFAWKVLKGVRFSQRIFGP